MIIAAALLSARLEQILHDYDGAVPGASVVVIRAGEVVIKRSFGLAEVESATSATPQTNYRLASVSKQFTAMAVLTLAKRGALALDDPITRFFPEFPAYGARITVRHLLTHSSGLIDYEDVLPPGLVLPLKDFDVLRILMQQDKTYFQPGSQFRYSNGGFALLALIVEKASGQTFARFLHDALFAPAGMANTLAYEQGISSVAHRAYGYSGDPWHRTDQSLTSSVLGDGGIYSSVDDLTKWIAWLDRNPLYRDATAPHMQATDGNSYGYGWFVGTQRGRRAVWHTGETIGFRNAVLRLPEEKLTVIILTNRNQGHPIDLANEIAAELTENTR